MINVHNFAGSSTERINDRLKYLTELKNFIKNKEYDYFIIAGDFNTKIPLEDYSNLLSFCDEIEGTPVNGGILGWFSTVSQEEDLKAYDNIIVSNNIQIEDIICDPMLVPSKIIHSDHTPVIATINFV